MMDLSYYSLHANIKYVLNLNIAQIIKELSNFPLNRILNETMIVELKILNVINKIKDRLRFLYWKKYFFLIFFAIYYEMLLYYCTKTRYLYLTAKLTQKLQITQNKLVRFCSSVTENWLPLTGYLCREKTWAQYQSDCFRYFEGKHPYLNEFFEAAREGRLTLRKNYYGLCNSSLFHCSLQMEHLTKKFEKNKQT